MKRHALFVGINDYADAAFKNLRYSLSDAVALSGAFAARGFDVEVLSNPKAETVLGAVERKAAGLGPGDVFLFFFAGHGFTSPDGSHLLICSNDRLAYLRHNRAGIPVDLLEEITNGRGCNRAFLLDACRTDVFAGVESRGAETRDLALVSLPDAKVHAGTCCVLRSCDRFCPAMEFEDLGHGVFTRAVMDVLGDDSFCAMPFGEKFVAGIRSRMHVILSAHSVVGDQNPCFQTNGEAFFLFDGVALMPFAPQLPPSYHQPSARNMKNVAIIGVEGSGKTVLMAVMGQRYIRPDAAGFFWCPLSFETDIYCANINARLHNRGWPEATSPDDHRNLKWEVFKQKERSAPEYVGDFCISYLAGETYRAAFGFPRPSDAGQEQFEVDYLKNNIAQADELLLAVNIGTIINAKRNIGAMSDTDWLALRMLGYLYEKNPECRVAVVFTQKDKYAEIINAHGGVAATFETYLPSIYYRYETQIAVFAVSAVNETVLDGECGPVPASNFGSEGIEELFAWMVNDDGREEHSERDGGQPVAFQGRRPSCRSGLLG